MADYEVAAGNNVSQLLRTIGSWGRPSMFRSMMVASSTAALLGVAFAATSGLMVGSGTLGFLVGSCVGFVGASVHYYRSCLTQALVALDEHPRLIQLHLAYNFPSLSFRSQPGSRLLRAAYWRDSWFRQGNLIAAWQSASGALDEIHDRKTQLLVEKTVRGHVNAEAEMLGEAEVEEGGLLEGK